MQAFLISTGVVAVAEIGDKTQLLALILGARYRAPVPVLAGILIATIANHGLAALVGGWIGNALPADWLRGILAVGFFAVAGWALVPDGPDDGPPGMLARCGAFAASLIAFFLVEMGDKTQVATVALASRFETLAPVVLGTTAGMMLVSVPTVLLCGAFTGQRFLTAARWVAAAAFAAMGVWTLFGEI